MRIALILPRELFHPGIVQVFAGHALVKHVVDDGEEAARQFRFAGQAEFCWTSERGSHLRRIHWRG